MNYILGIDQGTTGSTAIILETRGKIKASVNIPFRQFFPKPGLVEHDPKDIWLSLQKAVTQAIHKSKISAKHISCIGISNQRETVSLFDQGKALHRFIVWQDRRSTKLCSKITKKEASFVYQKTGLPIDPYFSSSKISWLKSNLKVSSRNKNIRFRTIDSFLLHKMTGADVTECTNAHRTQLLNLKKACWNSDLFSIFDIPQHWAPEVIPSESMKLKTKDLGFLPAGIPIQAVLGDQQAALFGQAGWKQGLGKITYGTGAFILLNTGDNPIVSQNKLASAISIQWQNQKTQYALEGSVFICGAWVQWMRDQLKIFKNSGDIEKFAKKVKDSGNAIVIPALSGMGAPFWQPQMRGAILGLTRGTNRNHLARASLEALAFQNKALLDAIKKDCPGLNTKWKVDGGAVKNDLLMQIQADILQKNIHRPKNLEATATGVALLAAYANKMLSLSEIEKLWKIDRKFKPVGKNKSYYSKLYNNWVNAIHQFSENS